MKTTKRLLSCLLVLAMLFALAIPAFAADGSITIEDPAPGSSYTIWKLFGANTDKAGAAISYTMNPGKPLPEGAPFSVVAGHVVWGDGKTEAPETLPDTAIAWLNANYTKIGVKGETKASVNGEDITFSGLEPGYYLMDKDGEATAAKVLVTTASVTIVDKNTTEPTVPQDRSSLKMIKVADDDYAEQVSVNVGSMVTFNVQFYTVNRVTENGVVKNVTQYIIKDTASATMDVDFTKAAPYAPIITIDGKAPTEDQVTLTKDTITIEWDAANAKNNSLVDITYQGKVLAADPEHPATNKAELSYVTDGQPQTPPEIPTEETKVYAASIIVDKYTMNGQENVKLENAVFALKNADGTKYLVPVYDATDKTKIVGWTESDAKTAPDGSTFKTDANGAATIYGLKAGSYRLEEVEAPAGYNRVDTLIDVEIKETLANEETDTPYKIENATSHVLNERGTVLPSTGGIGTTMFYVIGGLMVAAAVVVLVSKKRMGAEQ